MDYYDPCDECSQRPAHRDGLCWECWERLRREADIDREPDDEPPTDEESDRAQSAWERYHHSDDEGSK